MYVYNKQELADEDELFAMSYPGDSFTALDSLLSSVPGEVPRTSSGSRRLTGKRPRGDQLALDQSVLNDATEVILLDPNASNRKKQNTKAPQPAAPTSMQMFRLLHVAPKMQKCMRSPASKLRGDHIAIALTAVQARSRHERWLTVKGDRHSGPSAIRVLSLQEFLRMGSALVKNKFLRCTVSPEIEYHFHGLSMDAVCHNPSGTKLLTKFMESNALPGHNIFYVNDDVRAEVPEADAALQGFLAANVVCESAVQGAYQITPFGAGAVQYSRRCTDFNRFFVRRDAVALKDWTQWELLDLLLETGWCLKPIVLGQRVAPLKLDCDVHSLAPEVKFVYFHPRSLELGRSYLQCLNSLEELQTQGRTFVLFFKHNKKQSGVEILKHRAPASYYDQLLGKAAPKRRKLMLVDDVANPDGNILMLKGSQSSGSRGTRAPKPPPLLALEDRAEGDPEEGEEEGEDGQGDDANKPEKSDEAVEVDVEDFKPFTFLRTGRRITAGPRQGQIQTAWQAQCPYHRDPGDHPQTFCRRAINFTDESEEPGIILQLKLWCILGRACVERAVAPHGHKFVSLVGRQNPGEAALKERLEEGLRSPSWILHDQCLLARSSDSSSSSDD